MNARLQVMLESRQLEVQPSPDAEIEGMWSKAIRTLNSSRLREVAERFFRAAHPWLAAERPALAGWLAPVP